MFPAPISSQVSLLDSSLFLCLLARESVRVTAPWADFSGTGSTYIPKLDRLTPIQVMLAVTNLGHAHRCHVADPRWDIRNLTWRQGKGSEGNRNICLAPDGAGMAPWPCSVSFIPAEGTWARPVGKVGGEVKLSISYKNNKLFIMVMHIRGLVSTYTVLIWIFIFLRVLFDWWDLFVPPSHESNHKSYWMKRQWACSHARPMERPSNAGHSFLLPVTFGK